MDLDVLLTIYGIGAFLPMISGPIVFLVCIFCQYFKNDKKRIHQETVEAFEMETLDRDENMEAVNEKEPDQWMDRKIVLLGISEI